MSWSAAERPTDEELARLIAGGSSGEAMLAEAEIYDPSTSVFSLLPDRLPGALRYSTTTLLGDRTALIAGGYDDRGQYNSGAWIYSPEANLPQAGR